DLAVFHDPHDPPGVEGIEPVGPVPRLDKLHYPRWRANCSRFREGSDLANTDLETTRLDRRKRIRNPWRDPCEPGGSFHWQLFPGQNFITIDTITPGSCMRPPRVMGQGGIGPASWLTCHACGQTEVGAPAALLGTNAHFRNWGWRHLPYDSGTQWPYL